VETTTRTPPPQLQLIGAAVALAAAMITGFAFPDRSFGHRFEAMETHFDERFEAIERRLDSVDRRVDRVEDRLDRIEEKVDDLNRRDHALAERVTIVETVWMSPVARAPRGGPFWRTSASGGRSRLRVGIGRRLTNLQQPDLVEKVPQHPDALHRLL